MTFKYAFIEGEKNEVRRNNNRIGNKFCLSNLP
jgi:hypothetical protein